VKTKDNQGVKALQKANKTILNLQRRNYSTQDLEKHEATNSLLSYFQGK
jgi:hypothetical protein